MEKDVTSPHTGLTYRIRQFDVGGFFLKHLELIAPGGLEEGVQQLDAYLEQGMVVPQVTRTNSATDEQVCPANLGDDRLWLAAEIMHLNGTLLAQELAAFRWRGPFGADVPPTGKED